MNKYSFLGSVGFLALAAGYTCYDKSTNYVSAEARVKKVEAICYATYREDGKEWGTRDADCIFVRAAAEAIQDGKKRTIHESTYATVTFISPVDQRAHQSRIKKERNDEGTPIKVGNKITVDASKTEADKLWGA